MQQAMYTTETSHWYILLSKAQVASEYYLQADVENYLVYVLTCMSSNTEFLPGSPSSSIYLKPKSKKENRLLNIRRVGEQSLVVAGLFPDHATRTGVPLIYLMDKGRDAFGQLSASMPGDFVYAYISKNYVRIIDVLHKLSELCGGNHSIDLIQACELWQEAGSQHGWKVIENNIGAFPTATGSELHH